MATHAPASAVRATIAKQGSLAAPPSAYLQHSEALFGHSRPLPANKTVAARLAKAPAAAPNSTQVVVGEAPDGFGKQVLWSPDDAGLALVVFLAAGDPLGVMISGVRATDTIEFVSATGVASFAEETQNKGVGAFIGIVAAGANVAASAFGVPELAPVIAAAEKFADTQFEEAKVKTKRRDPFGVDPGTGGKARQEGGVLVSLPAARQIYYSGDSDHQERWVKKPGTRDAAHLPSHVHDASFLLPDSDNLMVSTADGDIIVYPWDYKFEDNFGFYRLHALLKRGSGTPPVILR
jgi:hypothetical protein